PAAVVDHQGRALGLLDAAAHEHVAERREEEGVHGIRLRLVPPQSTAADQPIGRIRSSSGRGADMARHAVLWGRDHPRLGTLVSRELDTRAAVAMSAGVRPKPYPSDDANEDVVLVARGAT